MLGTTIDELRLESAMQLRYRPWDSTAASVRFEYSERDEHHSVVLGDQLPVQSSNDPTRAEERKNNHTRRTSLASNLSIGLSRSHALSLSGSANLLRYDTPSIENDDDRDELWYFLGLNSTHHFGQYLTAAVAAELSMMHIVYLGSGRSANNTWNRIIRLSPKLSYRMSKDFVTVNTFEVLGNYTAYDFEFPSSDIRSFVYRHFSFVDSSVLAFTNRLTLSWQGQLKLYEQGELSWSEFSERPTSYFEDKMFAGMISYGIGRGLHFTVGIRFFSQSHYGYQGSEKQLDRVLRSTGPISELVYEPGARMLLSIKGWYETQTQTGQPRRNFTTLTMTFIVNI